MLALVVAAAELVAPLSVEVALELVDRAVTALTVAAGSVDVPPDVAGSPGRLCGLEVRGTRLSRDARLPERSELLRFGLTAVADVVPSVVGPFEEFEPAVPEFVAADGAGAVADEISGGSDESKEGDDCKEDGADSAAGAPAGEAIEPTFVEPKDPGAGLADMLPEAADGADPVVTAAGTVEEVAAPLGGAVAALGAIGEVAAPLGAAAAALGAIGDVAAPLGDVTSTWAAVTPRPV